MDDVTVRASTEGDLAAVQRVARRAWRAAYESVLDRETVEAMVDAGYDRSVLEPQVAAGDRSLLVAVADGEVVGFASGGPSDVPIEGRASVYLDPDWWGEGVGAALLERLVEDLADRGVTTIREHVLAANEPGVRFYGKHFEQTGERPIELGGEVHRAKVFERRL